MVPEGAPSEAASPSEPAASEGPPAVVPFRQVAGFWNWLPAFRAVAEWGGVLGAARALGTSASALSRAVGLLEQNVGVDLFRREGRSLALTPAGSELLAATRIAMRGVHDVTLAEREPTGPLLVGVTSRICALRVLPALAALRTRHAGIVPDVLTIRHDDIAPSLLSGRLHAAVTLSAIDHPDLVCAPLAPARSAVYCGKRHPLWRTPSASARAILKHAFAAPSASAGSPSVDGWPAHLKRKVSLRAGMLDPAIDACVRGELLAVLPIEVVEGLGLAARVRELTGVSIPDTEIFLVRLRPLGPHPNAVKAFAAALA
jgi:DNA-binding transcriptional LysR family regulator